jgi:hypothetical protein
MSIEMDLKKGYGLASAGSGYYHLESLVNMVTNVGFYHGW